MAKWVIKVRKSGVVSKIVKSVKILGTYTTVPSCIKLVEKKDSASVYSTVV